MVLISIKNVPGTLTPPGSNHNACEGFFFCFLQTMTSKTFIYVIHLSKYCFLILCGFSYPHGITHIG